MYKGPWVLEHGRGSCNVYVIFPCQNITQGIQQPRLQDAFCLSLLHWSSSCIPAILQLQDMQAPSQSQH